MHNVTHSGNGTAPRALPRPQRERWQPLRSGFVNIYRYDQEEFHYENGRLLLRGNNGTGKSRFLALQLPFLLDGEVTPQRLEPDADPAKRVEWNLLMGRYSDRTGYTWIEFGRRDHDGAEHFTTLGCGLSAVEGQAGVRKWFFITNQRIGRDFELTNESGQVIGKERLREKIGASGEVFEAVGAYRQSVNRTLFHLDDYRYASFVNLLIQLRRPQLTRRLDEDELSAALSEALPPVPPAVIADAAEAFSNLESDRNTLESLKTALAGVDGFLDAYRRYAEAAGKRRADRLLSTQAEYETAVNDIRAAEEEHAAAAADLERLQAEAARLAAEQLAIESEIAALQQSGEMKDSHAIERAYYEAKEKRQDADAAAAELADATQARKLREDEEARSRDVCALYQTRWTSALEAVAAAAPGAGLDPHGTRQEAEDAVQSQIEKINHLRKFNEQVREAEVDLDQSRARRDQISSLLDDARDRLKAAQQDHAEAMHAFVAAAGVWRGGLRELRRPFEDHFLNAAAEAPEGAGGVHPLKIALRRALDDVTARDAEERTRLEGRAAMLKAEIGRLHNERGRLESGETAGATRGGATPQALPGAPLWMLCDFVDSLDAASRAGLEAALEASGLLNAWVTPTGEILYGGEHPAALVAATSPLPAEDAHLGMLLRPAVTSGDGPPMFVVAESLRYVGIKPNSAPTWVGVDGRWQNGPLHGAASKPAAEYIGPAAREAARARRIAEIDRASAEAGKELEAITASLEALNRRELDVETEAAAAPSDEAVRAAYDHAMAVAREVDGLRSRLAAAEEQCAERSARLEGARESRSLAAADLGLAPWADKLDALERGIADYRIALAALWSAEQTFDEAQAAAKRASALLDEAKTREQRLAETAERLKRAAIAAEIEVDTMREALGADPGGVAQRIDAARRRLDAARDEDRKAQREMHDVELAVTRMDERLRNLNQLLNSRAAARDAAVSSMRTFAEAGLIGLAAPGVQSDGKAGWSEAGAVLLAGDLARRLEAVDGGDAAWEHHQRSAPAHFNELMQALSVQGCRLAATFRDDIFVVTAVFDGKECAIDELQQILSREAATRQMLLDAREREILENHLVGGVARRLQELLTAAEQQIEQMNIELDSRPMSTGMKLRFVWRPSEEGPLAPPEVWNSLLRASPAWTSAERHALGSFLHQQIQAVRSQTDGTTWQESLAEALDYRKWRRFGLERFQDGVWKRLTRRTHGTGSGGEKAVALTLPHFAAAAAFYRTADSLAPRLILLDEAFVGIDADMRSKCMGLIHTFDLDFIMTSEREWGCYETLPGLAIYQLSTRPGIDAVGLTRWVWNGRRRRLDQQEGVDRQTEIMAAAGGAAQ